MRNHYVIDSVSGVVHITLNRRRGDNLVTTVDLYNLPRLLQFDVKWTAFWHKDMGSFYAIAYVKDDSGKRTSFLLHRWLLDCGDEKIEHRNGRTLDNREANLRVVQRHSTNLSVGVHYDHSREQWFIVGKSYPLAKNKRPQRYFDTKEEAQEGFQKWCDYWNNYTFI